MARIKWLAALAVLWMVASVWWYDCRIKDKCAAQPPAAAQMAEAREPPLGFLFRDPQALIASEFPTYKSGILRSGAPDQALEIVGLHFSDEQTGTGLDLGILRAQAAARNFAADLEVERIKVSSRRVPNPAPSQQVKFAAVEFNWVALIAPVPAVASVNPLGFKRGSSTPETGPDFAAFRDGFVSSSASQVLEITGMVYADEGKDIGVELAQERAEATQDLFAKILPKSRTLLQTLQLAVPAPAPEPFAAVRFRWVEGFMALSPQAVGATNVTTTAENSKQLRVLFAVNSSRVQRNAQQSAELTAFVKALDQQSVRIVGRTDASGEPERNQRLAQRRARALENLLRQAGYTGKIRREVRVSLPSDPSGPESRRADAFAESASSTE